MAPEVVLDSSAVVAVIRAEVGADAVARRLGQAAMSVVNATEVGDALVRVGISNDDTARLIADLDIVILPPDLSEAAAATSFFLPARKAGLSLGDRHCLALARRLGCPAVTSDRAWLKVADEIGVRVELFR